MPPPPANLRYFSSASFPNGAVDMGKVRLLEGVSSFSQLVKEVIVDPIRSPLTRAQFAALPKRNAGAPHDQARSKRVGYLVPGSYAQDQVSRDGAHVPDCCNLIFLDLDESAVARRFVDDPEQLPALLAPLAFVSYHTASSTPENPKLRVIVSAYEIPSPHYPRAVHHVAELLGLAPGDFDRVSLEVTRAMYRPVLYRGDTADPILSATPEGEGLRAADLREAEDVARPGRAQPTPASSDGDLDHLRAPLEGFTPEHAAEALTHIDPDCGYNQWLELCMGLRHQFPRDPECSQAFEVFDRWSSTAKQKYEGREVTREKWDAVNTTARGRAPRTIRSLIQVAEEAGWSSAGFSHQSYTRLAEWIDSNDRSANELLAAGVKRIAAAHLESPVERDVLLNLLARRLNKLKMPVSKLVLKRQLDSLFRAGRTAQDTTLVATPEAQLPAWARGIIYVSDMGEFYQRFSDKTWTPASLDRTFNVFLNPSAENGKPPILAQDFLLNIAKIPRVSAYQYAPQMFDQAIVKVRNKKFINTYQASYPVADPSDIAAGELLMAHLVNLVAEPEYRTTLVDFLAYHVQNPGMKVRWAVLLQGGQGCGKTVLFEAMQAVLGPENAKPMNAETLMESRFTKWATGAQLRVVEEVRVVGENRYAVMNKMKPYITNDTVSIEAKGKDEIEVPNCTNYLMFSNHVDALAVHDSDRRYFVIQSPLQHREQILALGAEYFERLFHMIKFRAPGLRAWFEAWPISKSFAPEGHAPRTSYFSQMVQEASSELVNTVRELLHDGTSSLVQADLLSATTLSELLRAEGQLVPGAQLAHTLRDLGLTRLGRVGLDGQKHNIWAPRGPAPAGWEATMQGRFENRGKDFFPSPATPIVEDLL